MANPEPTMRAIFDKYHCDKGSEKHKYDRAYEHTMAKRRHEPIKLLEVGCYRGESTAAFVQYFPQGTIYTIDIFERTKPQDVKILQHERVKWLWADSRSTNLQNKIKAEWSNIKFDYIIDDGGHWPKCNHETFNNLFPLLKKGGAYFIEDVWMLDKLGGKKYDWVEQRKDLYNMADHQRMMLELEEHKLTHFDLRDGAAPDSYVLRIMHRDNSSS